MNTAGDQAEKALNARVVLSDNTVVRKKQ